MKLRKILLEDTLPQKSNPEFLQDCSLDPVVDAQLQKLGEGQYGEEVGEDKTGLITSNIANLVKNADKLFDIQGTILRRAINYVRKNNPEISDDIEVSLEEDFGLTLKDIDEKEDLYHQQTPEGGAAGPGESTSGGGGA